MRSDEFIRFLQASLPTDGEMETICARMPLGWDSVQNTVFAFSDTPRIAVKHVCVTGVKRTAFIKRLLCTLSAVEAKSQARFFILSPKTEYGELLHLKGMDVTVPYIQNKSDVIASLACAQQIIDLSANVKGKKLVLVLDGLENLQDCNGNMDLAEYREVLDKLIRKKNVEVVTGVDLMKSIFSGYPGAYVGIGNCLVTTREEGKADVTYVGNDCTLTMPTPISYPDSPSITETVIALNAVHKE